MRHGLFVIAKLEIREPRVVMQVAAIVAKLFRRFELRDGIGHLAAAEQVDPVDRPYRAIFGTKADGAIEIAFDRKPSPRRRILLALESKSAALSKFLSNKLEDLENPDDF